MSPESKRPECPTHKGELLKWRIIEVSGPDLPNNSYFGVNYCAKSDRYFEVLGTEPITGQEFAARTLMENSKYVKKIPSKINPEDLEIRVLEEISDNH